ncbi:hypothetical protein J1614_003059 [Plenodomus biglobosus]|nr:hypothetical protein J1614_003059 [Plenodomus biglobosus]
MASSAANRGVLGRDETDSHRKESPTQEQGPTNGYQQDATLTEDAKKDNEKEKKPNLIAQTWTKLGLDVGTLLMMAKAACPPTIALSMLQADAVARKFTTLGYLVAIISILGFCIMPRAKFIQTMTMNIIGTCLGSALTMLMLWTGIKAREHTTIPGASFERYNPSQSAVLGVWLFFQIYAINAVKAKFPQLAFPTMIYAIQVNVAATSGFLFTTTPQCKAFVARLLEAFLTGFGLATGVSLLIIPVTSRKVVMKETTAYLMLLRGALGAHKAYIHSMEGGDMYGQTCVPEQEGNKQDDTDGKPKDKPEIATIKRLTGQLQELHGKLTADLPFAKREIAYGKLTADDLEGMFKKLRSILLPVLGMGSVMDLFARAAEINHWEGDEIDYNEEEHMKSVADWNELFLFVHEPFNNIFQALDDGLAHVLLRLQLGEPPKKTKGQKQNDAEAKGDTMKPGDEGFAEHLERQASIFFSKKEPTLRHWVKCKGITLRDDYFSEPDAIDDETLKLLPSITTRKRDQRQLFTVLYIMFLLNGISRAILDLVRFADQHDLANKKNKFIWLGGKRFKKWMKSIFNNQDSNHDDETTIAGFDRNNTTVYMGDAYKSRKDPEHLPPVNAWEKFGNIIRSFSHFLRSPESAFGFRAACATMSIAIVAFLRDTQIFFVQQRLIWALIMVAISMTPTAGQSIFQFVLRIIGTAIAMVVAWLIWYIPGQHTPGILVFVFVFVAIGFYIPLKRLDLVIVGLISVVTATMIVGYELQVRKIGLAAATATGQPAYPIYVLGPYRLATVVGGLAIAFFWTFFPYPITEHSELRQKLGGALYLSANFYSIMHEQVMARIRGDIGDEERDKQSPGYALMKARNKVFAKQMLTIQGLKMHAEFVKWEFPLGGKFPRKEYSKILEHVQNIVNYTSLLGYASQGFTDPNLTRTPTSNGPTSPISTTESFPRHVSAQWFSDFRRVIGDARVTSHEITSLLAMLSSSITNGQPLPPYLHAPELYSLKKKLELVDPEILNVRHVAEPGFAAFAVMDISTRCIHMDIERLLASVKKLVGELDFSFHVVSTADSAKSSNDTLVKRDERRRKRD